MLIGLQTAKLEGRSVDLLLFWWKLFVLKLTESENFEPFERGVRNVCSSFSHYGCHFDCQHSLMDSSQSTHDVFVFGFISSTWNLSQERCRSFETPQLQSFVASRFGHAEEVAGEGHHGSFESSRYRNQTSQRSSARIIVLFPGNLEREQP